MVLSSLCFLLTMIWAIVQPLQDSQAGTLFKRVAQDELPVTGKSFGATWADVDHDGRLDLILGRHGKGVGLYANRPGLHFSRLDSCAFLPCLTMDQHGVAACDFNGDGNWELYVTVGADRGKGVGSNQFWQQGNSGKYANILGDDDFMADPRGRGRGGVWFRLDGDRFPELLVLNFKTQTHLFRYNGNIWSDLSGTLQQAFDQAQEANVPHRIGARWFATVVVGDWDNDGYADLFLGGETISLLHNDGAGGLEDVTAASGLSKHGFLLIDAVAGDVDNDGDEDILFANRWVGGLHIWLNESTPGKLLFRPGPDLRHLALTSELDSILLADFDNDGILDLYVMMQDRKDHNRPNLLARGLGNGDFADVAEEWGGRGMVEALPCGAWPLDLDRDGDLDLMLVHGKGDHPERKGICVLYENSTSHQGLTLTLVQPGLSPQGLGARVALHTLAGVQYRQVHSTTSYFNSTVLPVHFGLGDDPGPYRAVVTWAGGRQDEYVLPRVGKAYLIRADKALPMELP